MNYLHRTWAQISESALVNNLNEIRKKTAGTEIIAVVKADAYGHGAKIVAPVLEREGVTRFAVSNIEEALRLREYGIKSPVLILGYTPVNFAKALADNGISQCVYSLEFARLLSESAASAGVTVKIHIKLDTGMSRLGFDLRDSSLAGLSDAIAAAKADNLYLEGIFTHFAAADSAQKNCTDFTSMQYERFCAGVEGFKAAGLRPDIVHCDNSAAVCDKKYLFDAVRPGIILYGLTPDVNFDTKANLIPVMTLKSVVSLVKTIKAGTSISYGMTFTAKRDMRVATVSAGYADGYKRLLSGRGEVLLHGKRAKVLGRVCMDQMIVDVSDIENVKMGDEVILFGEDVTADEIAELCGTINYEIVCDIAPRVPRILVD